METGGGGNGDGGDDGGKKVSVRVHVLSVRVHIVSEIQGGSPYYDSTTKGFARALTILPCVVPR